MEYSSEDWVAATAHHPLADRPIEDLMLLHRHWMWANQQREALDKIVGNAGEGSDAGEAMLATRGFGFMFVWYGMLWAVIEACIEPLEGREIEIRGEFLADIDRLGPRLKRFRNAVLHVPRSGNYVDNRLLELVQDPNSVSLIRRVHYGFGRLILEELLRRNPEGSA